MSLPYLGDFLIFGAVACSIVSLVMYFLSWRRNHNLAGLARRFYIATASLVVLATATLMYLILTHDFTVHYVYSYSSTDLPFGYLVATLWGGQEGTFLLWSMFLSIFGLVMMRTAGKFEKGNMVFLNLIILSVLIIMLKKSPFELMPVLRLEGAGLNPLLQNFWMQIHPPIMFLGFAGAAFPFLFAMTGLVERNYKGWSEAARRWTMFAWATLGVSLVMGGYWAYETLGWGGFWAWDPVENSSLIPWIFLTTQVHTMFITRQRQGLMRFSLVMVCLSFWAVLYGTFLTRSGVLADFSVHSFVDLGLNGYLIGGLGTFMVIGISLLAWRWSDIHTRPSFSKVQSRSYMVTLGIVFLSVGGFLVLLGTSAPLLTRFASEPSSVGISYYFATMTPIAIGLLILIGMFPAFRWNKGLAKKKLLWTDLAVAAVTIATLMILGVTYEIMYLLLFGAAVSALVVNGYSYVESVRAGRKQPGYLSHVGLSLALIGAGASAGFETKETLTLPQGVTVAAMGHTFKFTKAIDFPRESGKEGFYAFVNVFDGSDNFEAKLSHEFPKNSEGVMKKPHVEVYFLHDLYLSPVAFEQPESTDPGTLFLEKGGSVTLDKYEITFHDYNMGEHGSANDALTATALITVLYDGQTEEIRPSLKVVGEQVIPTEATFDSGRGKMYITGVRPEDSGIILKVIGPFLPAPEPATASLILEVSKKPLILLFWLGTLTVFTGGIMSMISRRRREGAMVEPIEMGKQERELSTAP